MKINRLAVLLLPALLCAAASPGVRVPRGASAALLTLPDGFKVRAELALTPEEREKGLMFRKSMAEDRGMLFVFQEGGQKTFWMKNTLIDLDMVFLDDGMKVVRVFHRVPRSYEGQPDGEISRASSPAWCVLELAAGAARAHRIKPGAALGLAFPGPEKPVPPQKKQPAAAAK